mmetsp:Transcript_29907/g.43916  ORF Transcript_29907/g.43916 Transcript_29907/m.43916 type:complete len:376 (-) Transcript_29907:99-1226(-)
MTNDQNGNLLRIGIMGAARIARKNARGINNLTSHCAVTAVASRDIAKAKAFVNDNINIEDASDVTVFNNYRALLENDICDAVYIPLPTQLHKLWVIEALKAGKHVLVEKPVSITVEDYEEMIAVAKSCGKYLQDGTMFAHNPRMDHFLEQICDDPSFGPSTRITSAFTFVGNDEFLRTNIRCKANGDPLGCLGDLGWYCIRAAILVFSGRGGVASGKVARATCVRVTHSETNSEGVPMDVSCLVLFGVKKLSFHCSFQYGLRQTLEVRSPCLTARINDFVIPSPGPCKYEIHKSEALDMDLHVVENNDLVECDCGPPQEHLMWRTFSRLSREVDDGGWSNSKDAVWQSAVSLHTQEVANALLRCIQSGVSEVEIG